MGERPANLVIGQQAVIGECRLNVGEQIAPQGIDVGAIRAIPVWREGFDATAVLLPPRPQLTSLTTRMALSLTIPPA